MKPLYWVMSIIIFFCMASAKAEEFYSADVKVNSVKVDVAKSYTCTVTIHNDNDDNAHLATLVTLFPLHVKFLSSSANCTASTPIGGWNSFAKCQLGTMEVGQTIMVTVQTTLPSESVKNRTCGAFVSSKTPDPDRNNNYLNSAQPQLQ